MKYILCAGMNIFTGCAIYGRYTNTFEFVHIQFIFNVHIPIIEYVMLIMFRETLETFSIIAYYVEDGISLE